MRPPRCPQCRRILPSEDVNVAKDVAFCRSCNGVHPLSAMPHGAGVDPQTDLRSPPEGCWFRTEGDETIIGGSHRSIGGFILMLAFTLFWNGIVSVFVIMATTSTLNHLGIPLPDSWGFKIENPEDMGVGMTGFLWLFLTPFVGIGLFMAASSVSSLLGRTEIRIRPTEAGVFVGVGKIGYKKRFDPRKVRDVRIDAGRHQASDNPPSQQIIIESENSALIKVGSMLPAHRRKFVGSAVSQALRL